MAYAPNMQPFTLDEIEATRQRLEAVGLIDPPEKPKDYYVLIRPEPRRRTTRWEVVCPDHEVSDKGKTKQAALIIANTHIASDHVGSVEIRERRS